MNVHCTDAPTPAPAPLDCRAVLDLMPASVDPQVFGPRGDPRVAVELPQRFTARMKPLSILSFPSWLTDNTAPQQTNAA